VTSRYDRQIALFGKDGHDRLAQSSALVLGAGGLGMQVIQQLAYLGVGALGFADADTVDETNLNRLVGATPDDVGRVKVAVAERLVLAARPDCAVTALPLDLPEPDVVAAISRSAVVVGCFDKELPRLAAADACSQAGVPYLDAATEVVPTSTGPVYGGRVVFSGGSGCVSCLGVVDPQELARERMTDEQRRTHDRIYGVNRDELGGSGPSVVTLNGVVASLAAMETMCLLTGLRDPARQVTYRGDLAVVIRDNASGRADCPFCARWRGSG